MYFERRTVRGSLALKQNKTQYVLGYAVGKVYCCGHLVTKSCPTLCDPMDCNTPGFPILHYLPECAQTHIHSVSEFHENTVL